MVIEIVNQVASNLAKLGIVHNSTDDEILDGRHITIHWKKMLYFGSCGYLGLEHDPRIKAGAIEAVNKYGTQFSSSRAYVSSSYYQQSGRAVEENVFGKPLLLLQSLTMGPV